MSSCCLACNDQKSDYICTFAKKNLLPAFVLTLFLSNRSGKQKIHYEILSRSLGVMLRTLRHTARVSTGLIVSVTPAQIMGPTFKSKLLSRIS